MKMFTVDTFCCGFSLQLGTAVALFLFLFESCLAIANTLTSCEKSNTVIVLICVFIFGLSVSSGIFGLYMCKPRFLIPFMISLIILTLGGAIFIVAFALQKTYVLNLLYDFYLYHEFHFKMIQMKIINIIVREMIAIVRLLLHVYFFIIVLSYYEEMRHTSRQSATPTTSIDKNDQSKSDKPKTTTPAVERPETTTSASGVIRVQP